MTFSMMTIYRANYPEQNNRAEHDANEYWSDVMHEGVPNASKQFSKVFAEKKQNQKRAYEQRCDHVIYSSSVIIKPLFEKVNFSAEAT
jgi:hypothetical protein